MDQTPNELPLEALADRDVGIKLIGVGGGGSNAVDRLKMENLARLQLAVVNTDLKALGTFGFQTTSRGNPVYIQYIPRTLKLVADNLRKHARFARLREILAAHLAEIA